MSAPAADAAEERLSGHKRRRETGEESLFETADGEISSLCDELNKKLRHQNQPGHLRLQKDVKECNDLVLAGWLSVRVIGVRRAMCVIRVGRNTSHQVLLELAVHKYYPMSAPSFVVRGIRREEGEVGAVGGELEKGRGRGVEN